MLSGILNSAVVYGVFEGYVSYLDSQCCYFVCLFVLESGYIASLKWVVIMDDLLLVLTFIHLNVFFYRSETDVAVICCNLQYFGQFVNKLMFFYIVTSYLCGLP